ncbi:MAG: hypothetical protein KM310_02870 [Clostridiales bacterium]|nr:hypothetical protein [Clostridiales bacterium]
MKRVWTRVGVEGFLGAFGPLQTLWRTIPGLAAAFSLLTLVSAGLDLAVGVEREIHDRLGYGGPAVALMALPAGKEVDREALTRELSRFASAQGLAVAYERQPGGVISIWDERRLFPLGPKVSRLFDGSGPKALVNRGLVSSLEGNLERLLPPGAEMVGSFPPALRYPPETLFSVWEVSRYPSFFLNTAALPFGEGAYFIAGNRLENRQILQSVVYLLEAHGLKVSSLITFERIDYRDYYRQILTGGDLRSRIFVIIIGLPFLAQLLVFLLFAYLSRGKWEVAAVLGAPRPSLRRMIVEELFLHRAAWGLLTGALLGFMGALVLYAAGVIPLGPGLNTVALASAIATLASFILAWAVAWWEVEGLINRVPL